MGNHAKRSAIAKALKSRGLGKLYYGNKKTAWEILSAYWLEDLQLKLSYKPGQLVSDCDVFNHVIKAPIQSYIRATSLRRRGCRVITFDQFMFEDGRLSCGCSNPDMPMPREEIEQKMFGYLKSWNDSQSTMDMLKALNAGEHICDERGIKLLKFNK